VGLVKFHRMSGMGATPAELRRWLRFVGATPVSELFTLALCNQDLTSDTRTDLGALRDRVLRVLGENPALSVKDLAVDGKTLMLELGLSPGKHLGELLQQLLEVVTDEPSLNSRDGLLRCAREIVGV
jgi:tRNA nucleotidyltransferase (CCA-adding enzyme)